MTVTPDRITGQLRTVLEIMFISGQSEATAIAEMICDTVEDCDDTPEDIARCIAEEFAGWAQAVLKATTPTRPVPQITQTTDRR